MHQIMKTWIRGLGFVCSCWIICSPVMASKFTIKIPPPSLPTLLSPVSTDALAGALRGYLVKNVPPVLYEDNPGWGQTKPVANGVKWSGIHPHLQYAAKNDGDWRKLRA